MLLDVKDKRILLELHKNARMPVSKIAKKVMLSQEVVKYRINKLLKNKTITHFIFTVNPGKLGFQEHMAYFSFQGLKDEKTILNHFRDNPFTTYVASFIGRWDMVIQFYSKDQGHYNELINSYLLFLKDKLNEHVVYNILDKQVFSGKYLFRGMEDPFACIKKDNEPVKLDLTDFRLMHCLSDNARAPLTEIAEKIGLTSEAVKYRLKNLVKEGVIERFLPNLDSKKFNIQLYFSDLQFYGQTPEQEKDAVNFLKSLDNISFIVKLAEPGHYQVDFTVSSIEEFKETLNSLYSNFGNIIKRFEPLQLYHEFKYSYLPEGCLDIPG